MTDKASSNNMLNRTSRIIQQYGELLSLEEVAHVFKYPSAEAALKAHHRHSLPIKLFKFKNRKGWFATAESVISVLEQKDSLVSES